MYNLRRRPKNLNRLSGCVINSYEFTFFQMPNQVRHDNLGRGRRIFPILTKPLFFSKIVLALPYCKC